MLNWFPEALDFFHPYTRSFCPPLYRRRIDVRDIDSDLRRHRVRVPPDAATLRHSGRGGSSWIVSDQSVLTVKRMHCCQVCSHSALCTSWVSAGFRVTMKFLVKAHLVERFLINQLWLASLHGDTARHWVGWCETTHSSLSLFCCSCQRDKHSLREGICE